MLLISCGLFGSLDDGGGLSYGTSDGVRGSGGEGMSITIGWLIVERERVVVEYV